MKRILVRGNELPFNNITFENLVRDNLFGTNAGNMLFLSSVIRTLMVDEDTKVDIIKFNFPEQYDHNYINKNYDVFAIPLANAFRKTFIGEFERLTDLIKKLTIPCVVIGVGTQGAIGKEISVANDEDTVRAIKNFINAVLEKSSTIGIRGELTGQFLQKLGYQEEKHYTVIGCPSLYWYGPELPDNHRGSITAESRIAWNRKHNTPAEIHKFIERQWDLYPDHWFLPQTLHEYKLLYAGVPLEYTDTGIKKLRSNYPHSWEDRIFKEDRALGFTNVKTWLEFLSTCDLCAGSRIHGNIAGILAGTPAYIFVPDIRIREIAEYHNIPHMLSKDLTDETNLLDICAETDFSSIYKGHKERFNHYLDFLHANKLETVWDGKREYDFDNLPFDQRMAETEFDGPIHALASLPPQEQWERITDYYRITEKFARDLKHERAKYKKDLNYRASYEGSMEVVKNRFQRKKKKFVKLKKPGM